MKAEDKNPYERKKVLHARRKSLHEKVINDSGMVKRGSGTDFRNLNWRANAYYGRVNDKNQ